MSNGTSPRSELGQSGKLDAWLESNRQENITDLKPAAIDAAPNEQKGLTREAIYKKQETEINALGAPTKLGEVGRGNSLADRISAEEAKYKPTTADWPDSTPNDQPSDRHTVRTIGQVPAGGKLDSVLRQGAQENRSDGVNTQRAQFEADMAGMTPTAAQDQTGSQDIYQGYNQSFTVSPVSEEKPKDITPEETNIVKVASTDSKAFGKRTEMTADQKRAYELKYNDGVQGLTDEEWKRVGKRLVRSKNAWRDEALNAKKDFQELAEEKKELQNLYEQAVQDRSKLFDINEAVIAELESIKAKEAQGQELSPEEQVRKIVITIEMNASKKAKEDLLPSSKDQKEPEKNKTRDELLIQLTEAIRASDDKRIVEISAKLAMEITAETNDKAEKISIEASLVAHIKLLQENIKKEGDPQIKEQLDILIEIQASISSGKSPEEAIEEKKKDLEIRLVKTEDIREIMQIRAQIEILIDISNGTTEETGLDFEMSEETISLSAKEISRRDEIIALLATNLTAEQRQALVIELQQILHVDVDINNERRRRIPIHIEGNETEEPAEESEEMKLIREELRVLKEQNELLRARMDEREQAERDEKERLERENAERKAKKKKLLLAIAGGVVGLGIGLFAPVAIGATVAIVGGVVGAGARFGGPALARNAFENQQEALRLEQRINQYRAAIQNEENPTAKLLAQDQMAVLERERDRRARRAYNRSRLANALTNWVAPIATGVGIGAGVGTMVQSFWGKPTTWFGNQAGSNTATGPAGTGKASGTFRGNTSTGQPLGGQTNTGGFSFDQVQNQPWAGDYTHADFTTGLAGGPNNPANFAGGDWGYTRYWVQEYANQMGLPKYDIAFAGMDGATQSNFTTFMNAAKDALTSGNVTDPISVIDGLYKSQFVTP